MKPVYQTLFGSFEGNCFPACIASILEIPLEEVPHFFKEEADIINAIYKTKDFLNKRGYNFYCFWKVGDSFVDIAPCPTKEFKSIDDKLTSFWIAGGPIKEEPNCGHAVVYYGNEMVHNPNPKSSGINEVNTYFVLENR